MAKVFEDETHDSFLVVVTWSLRGVFARHRLKPLKQLKKSGLVSTERP